MTTARERARTLAILTVLLPGLPRPACASSNLGQWKNNLRQVSLAVKSYHDENHKYPTDICDAAGKPLLSWRLLLLPYLEQDNLYKEFHLNEPWDSSHNRTLIDKVPFTYMHPGKDLAPGRVLLSALRGDKTFLGDGKARREEVKNELEHTIMFVEADAEHALIWTKPADLPYDPLNPRAGWARDWRFGHEHGSYAAFADGKVRFISEAIDAALLRRLISVDETGPVRTELSWREALDLPYLGTAMAVSFLISMIFVAGGLLVAYRLVRRRQVAPGEMLWFIIGVQQLAFLIEFVVSYRYEIMPAGPARSQRHVQLWAVPALVGLHAALATLLWFRCSQTWRKFFAVVVGWFLVLAVDASLPHQHRAGEESLFNISHPVSMAVIAVSMIRRTRNGTGEFTLSADAALSKPGWPHWLGIAAAFVPLLWVAFGCFLGMAEPRDVLLRTNNVRD